MARETFFWFDRDELTEQPFWEAAPREELYVAEGRGLILGFASYYRPENFLHSLYVEAEARGLGVGSALFALVRAFDPAPLSLKVQKRNTQAIDFYSRRGLVFAGEGDPDMPGGGWYLMAERA